MAQVCAFLDRSYGGGRTPFGIRYPADFLRHQLLLPAGRDAAITVAISRRCDSQIVGFVAAVPVQVTSRGEARVVCLFNLWCVAPEFRRTVVPCLLVRRIVEVVESQGLLEGAVFTGRHRRFPCVGRSDRSVRVLRAEPLIALGLLGEHEVSPAEFTTPDGFRVRRLTEGDNRATALRQYQQASSAYDVSWWFDDIAQISGLLGARGVRTFVLERLASRRPAGWFAVFETSYYRAGDGAETARVANLWALGAEEDTPVSDFIRAVVARTHADGCDLLVFHNKPRLSEADRRSLQIRSAAATDLHTYGPVERYRGLSLNLPFC